jgi:aspartate-semialdehyde dehydrogenase
VDIALFSAGSAISKRYGPIAASAGAVVIDNSSAFRMDAEVPLVVPEINGGELSRHRGIIANPNCAAIISIVPLWPIHRRNRIRRLIVTTYQAASGAGAAAMEELREATRAHLEGREYRHTVLPHPYAFNVFSHNTRIDPATGYNEEEIKVINETRKIFADPAMRVTATCVRVPVLRAHCVALNFECERPVNPAEIRELLGDAPGVKVIDDAANNYFPMPKDASGQDDILVGRIRQDLSDPSGRSIALFCAGDQLLKGAALNAVQIAELVLSAQAFRASAGLPTEAR